MERRRETRISAHQPVCLTLLGNEPSGLQDFRFNGVIVDFSGRGMRLIIPHEIPVGAAVRLDFENQLVLGEVCYCQVAHEDTFIIGLELEQSLNNLDDLTRLVRSLMGDGFEKVSSPELIANRSR